MDTWTCCMCAALVITTGGVFILLLFGFFKKYKPPQNRSRSDQASVLISIGSGGHTKEILSLVSGLGCRYQPRYYVIANTDKMGAEKVTQFEADNSQNNQFSIHTIPRSREVKQSWVTTLMSTAVAIVYSFPLVFKLNPEIILCNGPGTCIPLCLAGCILKVFNMGRTQIVYVESICRVQTLSLSAKILYYLADDIFVQWPNLQKSYPRTKYIGRLV